MQFKLCKPRCARSRAPTTCQLVWWNSWAFCMSSLKGAAMWNHCPGYFFILSLICYMYSCLHRPLHCTEPYNGHNNSCTVPLSGFFDVNMGRLRYSPKLYAHCKVYGTVGIHSSMLVHRPSEFELEFLHRHAFVSLPVCLTSLLEVKQ